MTISYSDIPEAPVPLSWTEYENNGISMANIEKIIVAADVDEYDQEDFELILELNPLDAQELREVLMELEDIMLTHPVMPPKRVSLYVSQIRGYIRKVENLIVQNYMKKARRGGAEHSRFIGSYHGYMIHQEIDSGKYYTIPPTIKVPTKEEVKSYIKDINDWNTSGRRLKNPLDPRDTSRVTTYKGYEIYQNMNGMYYSIPKTIAADTLSGIKAAIDREVGNAH